MVLVKPDEGILAFFQRQEMSKRHLVTAQKLARLHAWLNTNHILKNRGNEDKANV